MELIKKEIIQKFGKKNYLLGIRKEDNKKAYLIEASWNCDWYWGFGYVETFSRFDICDHQHFDNLFLEKNIFENFINYFTKTTLNEKEIWKLLEYMKEFYILKEYAEFLQLGANISNKPDYLKEENTIKENKKEVERINKNLIPKLLQEIYNLLSKEDNKIIITDIEINGVNININ